MFTWNVEDMALLNQKGGVILGKEKIYDCEHKILRDDKIAFVDSMQDGVLSYLLFLIEKFNEDKENMPKDSWGHVKTVSLKAWIKKNDNKYSRPIIDDWFHYGQYHILGTERYITSEHKGVYDTYEDIVDELFHRQLKKCEEQERIYFEEHDEYEILKQKFRDKRYDTTFGVKIHNWGSGRITIFDKKEDGKEQERDITIEELKVLLSKYEHIDALVEKLTAETHIVY